jgi:hypothetical protein
MTFELVHQTDDDAPNRTTFMVLQAILIYLLVLLGLCIITSPKRAKCAQRMCCAVCALRLSVRIDTWLGASLAWSLGGGVTGDAKSVSYMVHRTIRWQSGSGGGAKHKHRQAPPLPVSPSKVTPDPDGDGKRVITHHTWEDPILGASESQDMHRLHRLRWLCLQHAVEFSISEGADTLEARLKSVHVATEVRTSGCMHAEFCSPSTSRGL